MSDTPGKIAIVIPTLGRWDELRKMLHSLTQQTRLPEQVVIVDEAGEGRRLASEFSQLRISVSTLPRGSASAKRNWGVTCVDPSVGLIGFMDDDIVLERTALEAMLEFWESAPEDTGGACCNWMNQPPLYALRLKHFPLAARLGLYASQGGRVMRSGFQTVIGIVSETRFVHWLPSGATVFPRRVLQENSFDEWFGGYSYLEDLDFSYSLGKKYRLAVVADARFCHYPSPIGRLDSFSFGKMEVANRLHFVRKHAELSTATCCLALMIRLLISLYLGITHWEGAYFERAWGNMVGLVYAATRL